MNGFQQFLGKIYPPYKFNTLRKEQNELFSAIIQNLPKEFNHLIELKNKTKFLGLSDWDIFPEYKFITQSYPEETLREFTKKGEDYSLSGIQIFSNKSSEWSDVEILVNQGHLSGLRISNSHYELKEFDLTKIQMDAIIKLDFEFPTSEVDLFYDSLEPSLKDRIDSLNFFDIQLGNRTFYAFYDLEDGNYLAVDKKLKVYSLIHDAIPASKLLKMTLSEILDQIESGDFNAGEHVGNRYEKSA